MYRLLRQTHLWAGISLVLFVFMYFATGFVMTQEELFLNTDPVVQTTKFPLNPEEWSAAQPVDITAGSLQFRYKVPGRAMPPRRGADGSRTFPFFRPGLETVLVINPAATELQITTKSHAWRRTWIGFHRLHGYGGGPFYDFWALLMDLSSLALIIFAVTGVWMWYHLEKQRTLGWILLALGFLYTLSTIWHLL